MVNRLLNNRKSEFPLYGVIHVDMFGDRNYLFTKEQFKKVCEDIGLNDINNIDKLESDGKVNAAPFFVYEFSNIEKLEAFLTGEFNCIELSFDDNPCEYISIAQKWTWQNQPTMIDDKTRNNTMIDKLYDLGIEEHQTYGTDREYNRRSIDFIYEIYQVNKELSEDIVDKLLFMPYEEASKAVDIRKEYYNKVYEGLLAGSRLEALYTEFNINRPKDFCGWSMSVSDVINIKDSNNKNLGSYYVDKIGFKSIPDFMDFRDIELKPEICNIIDIER